MRGRARNKEPENQLHPSQKTSKYVVHNRIMISDGQRQEQNQNRVVINYEDEPNEEFNSAGGVECSVRGKRD